MSDATMGGGARYADRPFCGLDLTEPAQQAAYVTDAFASGDPFLVVLALKEIGTARRVPVALDENPPLGEVLRVGGPADGGVGRG